MRAYREMPEDELFTFQWVKVQLPEEELPGYKTPASSAQHVAKGSTFAARSEGRKNTLSFVHGRKLLHASA